jgi:hypothetical protein
MTELDAPAISAPESLYLLIGPENGARVQTQPAHTARIALQRCGQATARARATSISLTGNPDTAGSRGSVPQCLPHEPSADFQALPEGPSWREASFVGQLDHRDAGEMDIVKGLADGQKVGASLTHRFGPLSVSLLIAEMEEDDLLSMVVNELNRIDPAPDQPVQVGAQLDIRNPRQSALEVVKLDSPPRRCDCGG